MPDYTEEVSDSQESVLSIDSYSVYEHEVFKALLRQSWIHLIDDIEEVSNPTSSVSIFDAMRNEHGANGGMAHESFINDNMSNDTEEVSDSQEPIISLVSVIINEPNRGILRQGLINGKQRICRRAD